MMNSRLIWRNICNWMAMVIAACVLSACGGGSKSEPPAVNATVEPVGTVIFGQASTFRITGSNLRSAFVTIDPFNPDRCSSLTELIKTNSEIVFQCIPNRLSVQFDVINNKGEDVQSVFATIPEPTIKFNELNVVTTPKLGAFVRFNIDGDMLLNTLLLPTSDNCAALNAISATKTRLVIECIPTALSFSVTVKSRNNNVIGTKTINLPSNTEKTPIRVIALSKLNFNGNLFKLNETVTYEVTGYLEGAQEPKVAVSNSDCADYTVIPSNAAQIVFSCKPQTLSAQFQIQDKNNNAIGTPQNATILVRMTTSLGIVDVLLKPAKAPITVANFMRYVYDDYYAGTIFHRLVEGFVNQGGGFTTQALETKPGLRDPIKLEPIEVTGLSNTKNTIAMARAPNDLDSATSQFYFNVVDNSAGLDDGGYAVFGEVVSGANVLETMNAVPRDPDYPEVALEDVVLQSVEQIQ